MKIMIVGAWNWPQYEIAFAKALEANGVNVLRFNTHDYFHGFWGKLQLFLPVIPGVALIRINRDLKKKVERDRPQWVLFWRPTHVLPPIIKYIQGLGIRTASYNNDDPFGPRAHVQVPWHHHLLWFWYQRCLTEFDRNFFYRKINCQESKNMYRVRHAEVLMPYFIPSQDRPVELTEQDQEKFLTDVVFVGHYEPDARLAGLKALLEAGIKVKIWSGSDWPGRHCLKNFYQNLQPIAPALGEDYPKALCGAKICLAFLSKLNRDTYTRRCFEIPACGRLMLAERTDDLSEMFKEDVEACYFSSIAELVDKVRWLLANPDICDRISSAGRRRVWVDGHDINSRALQFLRALEGKDPCFLSGISNNDPSTNLPWIMF